MRETFVDKSRKHPVTLPEFNKQVLMLIEQHGAAGFAGTMSELPAFTLFVDGETVVAEPADSPRYPYGAYYDLGSSGNADLSVEYQVMQWVTSEEAYQCYLSMNVCRYSC